MYQLMYLLPEHDWGWFDIHFMEMKRCFVCEKMDLHDGEKRNDSMFFRSWNGWKLQNEKLEYRVVVYINVYWVYLREHWVLIWPSALWPTYIFICLIARCMLWKGVNKTRDPYCVYVLQLGKWSRLAEGRKVTCYTWNVQLVFNYLRANIHLHTLFMGNNKPCYY